MKKTLRYITLSLAISLLAGCGDPTLDTTTEETMTTSINEMTADLPENEREHFATSIVGLYMLAGLSAMQSGQTAEEAIASINDRLHGKTVEEISVIVNEVKQNLRNK